MKYAIIAAGEGSRLAAEGVAEPKPLVRVGGEALIDRLIRVFMDNDAEEIVVICNDLTAQVSLHLVHLQQDGLDGRPCRCVLWSRALRARCTVSTRSAVSCPTARSV